MSDRFVYHEGDARIVKLQCELCKYYNSETVDVCVKYPQGKPREVLENMARCKFLEYADGRKL